MMKKQEVFEQTVKKLRFLSELQLKEVNDFVDFLLYKVEDQNITREIQSQASESTTFDFLKEEEELYPDDDLENSFR